MIFLLLQTTAQNLEQAENDFWDHVTNTIDYGFTTYKDFVFGLFIGVTIAWIYHRFVGTRNLRESYRILLVQKDETIEAYKTLVSEKLGRVTVDQKDKAFFKRLKGFFRKFRK